MERQQQMHSQHKAGTEMIKRLNESKLKDFDSFVAGARKDREPSGIQASLPSATREQAPRVNIDQNILNLLQPIPLPPLRSHKNQDLNDRV